MKLKKLTPNLVVRDVDASLNFYRTVLGFQQGITVPISRLTFLAPSSRRGHAASRGDLFHDQKTVAADDPALGAMPIGAASRCFLKLKESKRYSPPSGKNGAKITMPLKEQFYGMREFAFQDPEAGSSPSRNETGNAGRRQRRCEGSCCRQRAVAGGCRAE